MSAGATDRLTSGGILSEIINIEAYREKAENAMAAGAAIVLWAETEGGCVIGGSAVSTKGVDPATVGDNAAKELLRNLEHGGCVDEHMQVSNIN